MTPTLFTIFFSGLVLREKATRRQLSGTAVASAGLAVIVLPLECPVGRRLPRNA